jgi:hypothetical protein
MKKIFFSLITLVASVALFAQSQQTIAYFSFNGLNESPNVQTVIPADGGLQTSTATLYLDGTNGSSSFASGELGRFTGSTVNLLSGFDKGYDLALQTAASNQKSAVFKLSTSGFQALVMTYAFKRTAQGHHTCLWSYSTDGVNFTALPTPADQPYTGAIDYRLETVDLSGITALNDQATVYLKLYVDGCEGANSKIRLDNFQFNAYPGGPDIYPPHVTSVTVTDSNHVTLLFNEGLDQSSLDFEDFTFDNGSTTVSVGGSGNVVVVGVTPAFPNGIPFNMFVQGVEDVAGNEMAPDTFALLYGIPTEFMCADIATLRSKLSVTDISSMVKDSIEYEITGSVIVTAVAEYKNQKVLQDETGAILVFDEGGVFGNLEVGDEVSGIYGKLTNYYGFLELSPTRPYENLVGYFQEVDPMVITLAQLNDNDFMIEHQAELIELEDVTITSSGNFAKLTRYDLSQAGVTGSALFAYFQDVNYLTLPIPTGVAQNITGFNFATSKIGSSNFDFRYYIVPRSTNDMSAMTKVADYGKMRISVYPNPTANFVTVEDVDATDVEIYDINGKKVSTQNLQNTKMVSLQSMSAGSYFLRLLKDGEIVGTAKVIKR